MFITCISRLTRSRPHFTKTAFGQNWCLPAMEGSKTWTFFQDQVVVLLGAGSAPCSDNKFSPRAVDEDEPMDVADHQDAVVVRDESSEVSVRNPNSPRPQIP